MDILNYLYESNIALGTRINPNGKEIIGVKPIINKTHFRYDFENELNFLDVFDINKSELFHENGSDIYTDYIYRGHKDAEWDLLPSVFRKGDNESNENFLNKVNTYKNGNGVQSEVRDFALFVKEIDRLGYSISDSSFEIINYLDKKSKINGASTFRNSIIDFPQNSILSELGLAQHYGVKTRLLDFTEDPFTALFFATESAFPFESFDRNSKKRIGIWVIPKLLIEAVKYERFLNYVDVKKFQNKYISAQRGVFLHYFPSTIESTRKCIEEDITLTLDMLLSAEYKNEFLNKLIKEHIGKPMLFTLPHDKLIPIAKRLNQLNINWATLMPSLDGVQKEVERQNKNKFSNII